MGLASLFGEIGRVKETRDAQASNDA